MKIPSMTILSSTPSTAESTRKQLEACFTGSMTFKTVIFSDELEPFSISDDYVLITNTLIREKALKYIKPGTRFLISDRTINADTAEKLYDIPEGTDVLLVNVSRDTAHEALTQLQERGIRHLHFFPYYPGIAEYNRDCPYAITFGDIEYVPEGDFRVIDLKPRPMDMTTCVKIAIDVGLYDKVKRNISTHFMRSGIEISYNYAKQLKKNQVLTGNLQMILDRFRRNVLLVNEARQILFFNRGAQRLLKIQDMASPYVAALMQKRLDSGGNFFFTIEGRDHYVETIGTPGDSAGTTIFVIDDIESIEKIENDYRAMLLKDGLIAHYTFDDIIFESLAMKQVLQKAKQFAKGNSTIAIYGDSGSGKELIAQAIHNASGRKNQAFVAINFAALSATLSEAELFGYVEGAFTGAKRGGRKGLFELAHRGTIFLDEIGDCSLDVQKKILRVIQERKVMPIGGNKLIPVDIRIIAATNQDLCAMAKNREFREDLFYRLNVLPLKVPALWERKEDIMPLFLYFMNEVFGVTMRAVPLALREALLRHPWRGNVRELRNAAEYIANCMITNVPWEDALADILVAGETKAPEARPDDIADTARALAADCELTTAVRILRVINGRPFVWSRASVTAALDDPDITAGVTKRYLAVLQRHGLIQAKVGSGSHITPLGKEFLRSCEGEF